MSNPRRTLVAAAAKLIRLADTRANKYRVSRVQAIADRAAALDILPETRHASYPLAWLIDTGRLSSEAESALLALSPRAMADRALEIAASLASVRDCADAWKRVAIPETA